MNDYIISVDENGTPSLQHYGIKGQKWGVRRFQNADGTLTAEGRRRAKREYKKDNKEAFDLGRTATIMGRAKGYADKAEARARAKYEKNASEKNRKKLEQAKATKDMIDEANERANKQMKEHYNKLVNKYGKDAVSSIKFDKRGRVNERVNSNGSIAATLIADAGALAVGALTKTPIIPVFYQEGKNGQGRNAYNRAKNLTAMKSRTQTL